MTIREEIPSSSPPEPPIVFASAVVIDNEDNQSGAIHAAAVTAAPPPPPPIAPQFVPPNDGNCHNTLDITPYSTAVVGGPPPATATHSPEYNGNPHNIPYGRWRNSLCGCFDLGCCHPLCCLTFCVHPCTLGQLLTRMKLTWYGRPLPVVGTAGHNNGSVGTHTKTPVSAFKVYVFLMVLLLALNAILVPLSGADVVSVAVHEFLEDDDENNDDIDDDHYDMVESASLADQIRAMVYCALWLLVLLMTWRLRQHVRGRYGIPEESCHGCEDFCCACCCICCTLCQIGRHTADYRAYGAGCCTETGLSARAPEVV